jgi:hypothetical protein
MPMEGRGCPEGSLNTTGFLELIDDLMIMADRYL